VEPPHWNTAVNANASEGDDLFGPGWESIRRGFELPLPDHNPPVVPPRR
jgi:hypothetical protein